MPGNLNCAFPFVNGEALMMSMKTIAVSSGSACTSANPEPSHVLRALGLSDDLTRASLRFGLGRFNTEEEIDYAVAAVAENVHRLRQLSSLRQAIDKSPTCSEEFRCDPARPSRPGIPLSQACHRALYYIAVKTIPD